MISGVVDIQEVLGYLNRDCFLDKRRAAEYLSVSPRLLEARKDIPRFRFGSGGKVLFKRSELDAWMEKYRVGIQIDPLERIANEALEAVFGGGNNMQSVGHDRKPL
jgi:excisionase family DNA binding protein